MVVCSVSGCDSRPVRLVRGFCDMHYKRLQRHGDVEVVLEVHKFTQGFDPQRYVDVISHGMMGTPTYISWKSMKTRCRNPNAANYSRYGAAGITFCDRWDDFYNFFEDMGERPEGTSLDRIDSTGNYVPSNCRWATYKEQARNSGRKK